MKNRHQHITDEDLMALVVRGDQEAYAEIYHRYATRILRFLFRMVDKNESVAQDLLHDVFLKVARHPEKFDGKGTFKSWIFSVSANHCRNYLSRDRHRKQLSIDEEKIDLTDDASFTNGENTKALTQEITRAIERLPTEYKSAFVLHYQQGLSVNEIAEVSNCPAGTIKSRLFQARKKLSELLAHHKHFLYES